MTNPSWPGRLKILVLFLGSMKLVLWERCSFGKTGSVAGGAALSKMLGTRCPQTEMHPAHATHRASDEWSLIWVMTSLPAVKSGESSCLPETRSSSAAAAV